MATNTVKTSVTFDGRVFSNSKTTTTDGVVKKNPTMAAAKTGTLTARTDADTGTVTAQSGHGIVSTNKIDVFWDGGCRRGMTATVTVNSLALDGGAGDNLPVVSTAVTLMLPQSEDFVVTGDNLTSIVLSCPKAAAVTFLDGSAVVLWGANLEAGQAYVWTSSSGVTNPLAGAAVASVKLSHSDSGASREVFAGVLYD